jgi:hypothetical protein
MGTALRVLAALLLAGWMAITLSGQSLPTLLPVDEAPLQPDFFSFRAQLQRAVAARDAGALLAVIAPDIRNSFGDDGGIDAFERQWRPRDAQSELWQEIGTVLALGGSFQGTDTFAAPYTFSRWPDAFDPFEHVALVASNVRLRAAPRADAPVRATLSFAVLPLASGAGTPGLEGWRAVRLPSGEVGHLADRLARSPIDYRAIFERRAGSWRLVSFVAGD